MRQWVLVTRFNPLTAYLFDTPYIRFGAEEFHLDDFKNIDKKKKYAKICF